MGSENQKESFEEEEDKALCSLPESAGGIGG